jgi:hypothetical protein
MSTNGSCEVQLRFNKDFESPYIILIVYTSREKLAIELLVGFPLYSFERTEYALPIYLILVFEVFLRYIFIMLIRISKLSHKGPVLLMIIFNLYRVLLHLLFIDEVTLVMKLATRY